MPASINDKFSKVISGTTRPVATTLSAQKISGATTASVVATTGWDTATAVHGIMYNTDANNAKVAGSQIDWKGTISGTTISNFTVTAGNDTTYDTGAAVELSPTAAWADDLVSGLVVSLNQDGTIATDAVDTTQIADDAVTAPKLVGIDKSNLTTDSNPYSFSAYMGSTQSTAATTWTKINMNTEEWDTNSNYDTTTYGYTIPVTGYYVFSVALQLQSQVATPFIISISTDGTTEYRRLQEIPNTTGNISLSGSVDVYLTASTVVYPMYYSGTASKTLTNGAIFSKFSGRLLHRT